MGGAHFTLLVGKDSLLTSGLGSALASWYSRTEHPLFRDLHPNRYGALTVRHELPPAQQTSGPHCTDEDLRVAGLSDFPGQVNHWQGGHKPRRAGSSGPVPPLA